MAKKSAVEREKKRTRLVAEFARRRKQLKTAAVDADASPEDRFNARLKLAQLPRNSSPSRQRLRCEVSGRSRGNYRKFRLSRVALRDLASAGQIPGMVKSSW